MNNEASRDGQLPAPDTAADTNAAALSIEREVDSIFDDPEAQRNVVGLFDLLLKIDRRLNPQTYANHD